MADNNDKNRSVLQMLRARTGLSGGLGSYEVARTTVIRCPVCATPAAHDAGRLACAACGHAFRSAETGAAWHRHKDDVDVPGTAESLAEVGSP